MAKFAQGYWLYPDGRIFWGGNGVHAGHFGRPASVQVRSLRFKLRKRLARRLAFKPHR